MSTFIDKIDDIFRPTFFSLWCILLAGLNITCLSRIYTKEKVYKLLKKANLVYRTIRTYFYMNMKELKSMR